jgi:hypothetical protein
MKYQTYDDLIALVVEFRLHHKDLSNEERDRLIRHTFNIDRATLREIDGISDLLSFLV